MVSALSARITRDFTGKMKGGFQAPVLFKSMQNTAGKDVTRSIRVDRLNVNGWLVMTTIRTEPRCPLVPVGHDDLRRPK